MKSNFYNFLKSSFVGAFVLLWSISVSAQDRRVTGKVIGADGPVPGANVQVKGSSTGVTANANGEYAIAVKSGNDVLVISSVGYKTREVKVGSQSNINVTMEEDAAVLSEVVVTGYASQQKKDITGSVVIVDTKELQKVASATFGDQLQGKVAGVTIGSSGDPGAATYIRIRGIGTIGNNDPLFIIDGLPLKDANLSFLNPSDIESMQVLKDASAASIYGSRAANGVIIITTKRGKAGVSKINVDMYTGIQQVGKYPTLTNPTELLEIEKGLWTGSGKALKDFNNKLYINNNGNISLPDFITKNGGFVTGDPAVNPAKYYLTPDPTANADDNYLIKQANKAGTDWYREVFNDAPITNLNVSANGGSEKGNYSLSLNYLTQNGLMKLSGFERFSIRANTTYNVKKHVRLGENLAIAYQNERNGMGNPSEGSVLVNTMRMPQIVPVYDINGYWAGGAGTGTNAGNPLATQYRNDTNKGYSIRMFGNVYAEVDFLKYFTAKTSFGLNYQTGDSKGYGYRNFEATEVNSANSLSRSMFLNINWNWYNTLQFNKTFADVHRVTAMVGTEAVKDVYRGFTGRGGKLAFGDDLFYRVLGNTDGKTYGVSDYEGDRALASEFAKLDYAYADKYMLSATIRRDRTSRFTRNREGTFPAGSIGWRVTKESFMQNVPVINDLKIRAGYGTTGNQDIGSDYPTYSNFGTEVGTSSYDINGTGNSVVAGFRQQSTGNPDLKWESTTMSNIGVDVVLLSNKLNATIEVYDRRTTGMLYPVQQPATAGQVGSIFQNIGAMKNTGFDISLGYSGSALNNELKFNISANASKYQNTVSNLDANDNTFVEAGGSRIGNWTRTQAGFPISQFRGYISDGVIQSEADLNYLKEKGDAKVGRLKFRDLNGDGKIDAADETEIGSPHPKLTYGFNLSANYKGFDFTAFLQGVYGNQIINYVKYFTDFPVFQANHSKAMLTEAGKTYPKLDGDDGYSSRRSSFYVESGSYLRGRNFQLGYTIPSATTSKYGIDRLRVYVQAQNLFTVTNYSGLDPDVTIANIREGYAANRDYTLGFDQGRYPFTRTILMGLNIEF